jgi:cytochrome oxidase Cu insertion factor (SCO1/SenC/PrrC family)
MTSPTSENPGAQSALSEEQRATAFAQANASVGRDGLPRVGRAPIPTKFVLFVTAVFVVLGVGGVVIEHYFGGGGAGTTTTILTMPSTPVTPAGPQLNSTTEAFMGLRQIASAHAATFTLRDQNGREWSLARQRGKVVVLTFLNVNCNDICPVEGAEIRQAQSLLGAMSTHVEFAIVNSDPHHTRVAPAPLALSVVHLEHLRTVHFLTGALEQLNAVWIDYGLAVTVGTRPSQVAHNNVMYFIAPSGRLRSLAVPFGNEDGAGAFGLAQADVRRFARGIASVAISLVR